MVDAEHTGSIRGRLAAGEYVFGPFLKIPASATVELVGWAGFDFCVIDLEHSPFTFERAEDMVRVAQGAGVAPIIRTYDGQSSTLVRALDTGCDGILVPNLATRAEAEMVVGGARFHPLGQRGMDPHARSARYRTIPKEVYFAEADGRTLVGVQIEGMVGVRNLGAILDVEGTDLIFIGPYDLSQSLGVPGKIHAPQVRDKVKEIVAQTVARGKAVGIYADTVEDARRWRDLGIQFVAISVDVHIFLRACQQMVAAIND
ncbi:HpcH/HpaI aldolase/citrate lyase family protein [Chloroflexota bacterium]